MAKKGGNVFRNPVEESATKVSTLPDLTAYQAKWGGEGRPSPKTGTTGAGITKYGTQQLKYVDNDPSKGVIEIDTGANFRLGLQDVFKSAGIDFGEATTFSETYQRKRPATIKTYPQLAESPHAPPEPEIKFPDIKFPDIKFPDVKFPDIFGGGNGNGNGTGQCVEDDPSCGVKEFFAGVPAGTFCKCPNWYGWDELDKHGCECDACKSGTGQCSDKCGKCDAWDIGCEAGCATEGITEGIIGDECGFLGISCMLGDWWDKYGIYVLIVAGLIGLGVLLYLLKPLFNMVSAIKGGGKNA